MNGRTPKNLLFLLNKHFNTTDLRELAPMLGIAYENLAGDTKKGRMISLIEHAEQHQKVDDLLALVVEKRPFFQGMLGTPAIDDSRSEENNASEVRQAVLEAEGNIMRQQIVSESFWGRKSFGTKVAIISTIVTIISIIVALIGFYLQIWPIGVSVTATPTSAETILLQVQVNSAVDQSSISNATVRLDIAGQLFSPEYTDSNGRAVFELPVEMIKEIVHLTVEQAGYESKDQNVTLDSGLRSIEFQLRPLP